jgi:hypothetical protein
MFCAEYHISNPDAPAASPAMGNDTPPEPLKLADRLKEL